MNQAIFKANKAHLMWKVFLPLVFGLAILLFLQPPAQAVQAMEGEGPNPAARYIKKQVGGPISTTYLKRKADQILERWRLYEETPEGEPLKKELYYVLVQKKDELISRIHHLCSESKDSGSEYCLIYTDTVRMLAEIPDLIPGKW